MEDRPVSDSLLQGILLAGTEDEQEIVDIAGYQVAKGEFFSHTKEPSITLWHDKIKFNMACIRRFPRATHIQLLIHTEQRRLIIRPCDQDAPDSLRWVSGGGEKEAKNKEMTCRVFAAKLFDLMRWDREYRYKLLGKPAIYKNEMLFLFKLTDFELFVSGGKNTRRAPYYPEDWRDYFGVPVHEHEEAYHINLADGYVTADNKL